MPNYSRCVPDLNFAGVTKLSACLAWVSWQQQLQQLQQSFLPLGALGGNNAGVLGSSLLGSASTSSATPDASSPLNQLSGLVAAATTPPPTTQVVDPGHPTIIGGESVLKEQLLLAPAQANAPAETIITASAMHTLPIKD